jgi:SNF2 family DNA or RNA helicase
MLDLIEHALGVEVIDIFRIQGAVEELDRVAILNRFKMGPSIRVMLVSLRAGGEGPVSTLNKGIYGPGTG